jgi:cysteinyl-tRNA synthetase
MKLYNTLSRQKEDFKPLKGKEVSMYYCGMTLQESPHIGHIRAALTSDIINRYLRYLGYDINLIVNFTDIDDKVIVKAEKEGKDYREIAAYFENEYKNVITRLNILKPAFYPRATQHIEEIINLVQRLEMKRFAYQKDGDVFFSVRKFKDYGKLSRKKVEDLRSGSRIEVNQKKEDPLDFVLWKKAKTSEPSWLSPWGKGRPGWHIECSAMASYYLGDTIDIHGGGSDLIFPHHENEIAQSETATGKAFAKFWVHNEMLNIKGEKMSKSLSNFVPIRDLLDVYDPNAIRLYILQAHYRNPIDYNTDMLKQAASGWEKIMNFLNISKGMKGKLFANVIEEFESKMNDDIGTPGALALAFDIVNKGLKADKEDMGSFRETLTFLLTHLGFDFGEDKQELGPAVEEIVKLRNDLRDEGNYDMADRIRTVLEKSGILIQDNPEGSIWRLK